MKFVWIAFLFYERLLMSLTIKDRFLYLLFPTLGQHEVVSAIRRILACILKIMARKQEGLLFHYDEAFGGFMMS